MPHGSYRKGSSIESDTVVSGLTLIVKVILNLLVLMPFKPTRGIELYLDWYGSTKWIYLWVGHLLQYHWFDG